MREHKRISHSNRARKSLIRGVINSLKKANNLDELITDNLLITRDNSDAASG